MALNTFGWRLACFVALAHAVFAVVAAACLHTDALEEVVNDALNSTTNATEDDTATAAGFVDSVAEVCGNSNDMYYGDLGSAFTVFWFALLLLPLVTPLLISSTLRSIAILPRISVSSSPLCASSPAAISSR